MSENQHSGNWWIWKVFWILLGVTAFEVMLGILKVDCDMTSSSSQQPCSYFLDLDRDGIGQHWSRLWRRSSIYFRSPSGALAAVPEGTGAISYRAAEDGTRQNITCI